MKLILKRQLPIVTFDAKRLKKKNEATKALDRYSHEVKLLRRIGFKIWVVDWCGHELAAYRKDLRWLPENAADRLENYQGITPLEWRQLKSSGECSPNELGAG
jgi:hypothetical protein